MTKVKTIITPAFGDHDTKINNEINLLINLGYTIVDIKILNFNDNGRTYIHYMIHYTGNKDE